MSDNDNALLIGGVLLLAMLGSRRRSDIPWGTGWHWPVPDLVIGQSLGVSELYPAVVSDGFQTSRPDHYGVDIDYRRASLTDRPEYAAGSPSGTTMHFAPQGVPILAAKDARVWSVEKTARGWAVVLDHGKPFATFYQHLEDTPLSLHQKGLPKGGTAPTYVKAGDVIGRMGADPSQGRNAFRHLHFAVWYKGSGDNASVDPVPNMAQWSRGKFTV